MTVQGDAETPGERLDRVFSHQKLDWSKFTEKRLPYDKKYCQKLIDFFSVGLGEEKVGYLGASSFKANPLPHLSAFARQIGTDEDTLNYWATIFPEWKAAMQMATDMRNELLKDNALLGNYDSKVATLFLGHYAGIKDKTEAPPNSGQLPLIFAQTFDRYLEQRGEPPVKLPAPDVQDAEIVEPEAPMPPPPVSEMGKEFKEFSAKRSKKGN